MTRNKMKLILFMEWLALMSLPDAPNYQVLPEMVAKNGEWYVQVAR